MPTNVTITAVLIGSSTYRAYHWLQNAGYTITKRDPLGGTDPHGRPFLAMPAYSPDSTHRWAGMRFHAVVEIDKPHRTVVAFVSARMVSP